MFIEPKGSLVALGLKELSDNLLLIVIKRCVLLQRNRKKPPLWKTFEGYNGHMPFHYLTNIKTKNI